MDVEKVVKLWRRARDPAGCSVAALSEASGLERSKVEQVTFVLRDAGFMKEVGIGPGGFHGWVSWGSEELVKEVARHHNERKPYRGSMV